MFKVTGLLLGRKLGMPGNSSLFLDFTRNSSIFRKFTTSIGSQTSPLSSGVETESRMLGSFSIFKGKAALFVSSIPPKFGTGVNGLCFVKKQGRVLLKFVPAIGTRKYDISNGQFFALSPIELGSMITLGPRESCELVHDPSMKSSLEGQVKKNLSVTPLSSGDSGYFMNLTVNKPALKKSERFSVPITKAEFAVMRSTFSFVLPLLMGWDRVVPSPASCNSMKLDASAEWNK